MKKKLQRDKMRMEEQKNILIVAVITSFITTFMGSALNLSIPAMEKEFNESAQNIGWVITVYMLVCSCLAVTFGKLADILDRKLILRTGIMIFAAASAAAVISRSMPVLLVFRGVQGIGASMIFSTNIAVLTAAFDEKEMGKTLGYATCATYVGLSLGPVVGGVLNHHLGWRSIFLTTAGVSALAFYFAMFRLSREKKTIRQEIQEMKMANIDIAGNGTFIAGVFMLMYGLSEIREKPFAPWLLAAGVLALIAFAKIEEKDSAPLINVKTLKENPPYTLSNLAALLNYGATFAVSYLLSLYLQSIKEMTSQEAGFVLITSTAVMAIFSPVFGKISDKKSPFLLSALGMVLSAAASAALCFLKESTPIWQLLIILGVSGLGFALFASPNTNAVMSFVKKEDYASASALLATMRSGGHTLSMAVITLTLSFCTGDDAGSSAGSGAVGGASADAIMQSIKISFFIFTLFCILGIFMAIKRKM